MMGDTDRLAKRYAAYCDTHGKCVYRSRRSAKANIREMNQPRLREYRCDAGFGWHVGHFPPAVARGEVTVRQVYGR